MRYVDETYSRFFQKKKSKSIGYAGMSGWETLICQGKCAVKVSIIRTQRNTSAVLERSNTLPKTWLEGLIYESVSAPVLTM